MMYATITTEGKADDGVANAIRFAGEASVAFSENGDQFERGLAEGVIHALRAMGHVVCPVYEGSPLSMVYFDECKYIINYDAGAAK